MTHTRLYLGIAAAVLLLAAAKCSPDNKGIKELKACASSETTPESVILYTGPVGVGPGSRWIRFKSGLVQIAADVSDIFPPPVPKDIYAPLPTSTGCTFDSSTKISLSSDLGVNVSNLPVSADLKAKLGKSAKVTVAAEGFEWESVKFDVYNHYLSLLPDSSSYKRPGPNRLTALSMLKVKGYTATVDLASTTSLGLTANYKGPLPSNLLGDASGDVSADIDSEGKLEIKVPGETYIMGVFRPINAATGQTESATVQAAPATNELTIQGVEVKGSRRLQVMK